MLSYSLIDTKQLYFFNNSKILMESMIGIN